MYLTNSNYELFGKNPEENLTMQSIAMFFIPCLFYLMILYRLLAN